MSQGGYYSTVGLIYIQSKTVKIKDDFAFLCVSYLPRKLRQSKAISLHVSIPGLDNMATHMKEVREEIADISRFFRELRRARKEMRVSLLFVASVSQGFEVWCGDSICPFHLSL